MEAAGCVNVCVCWRGAEIPTLSPAKLIIWGSLSLSVCFIPLLPPPLPSLLYLRVFLDSIIPLELQKYLLACMCIQSKLDRLRTNLSMRSFCAGERLQGMKEEKSEKRREVDTTKGTLSWGERERERSDVQRRRCEMRLNRSESQFLIRGMTHSQLLPFLLLLSLFYS